jgi:hypothetical protein
MLLIIAREASGNSEKINAGATAPQKPALQAGALQLTL